MTEKAFDAVPIDEMKDAEQALREAAESIPAEVCARFETADKLSDEDRKAIVDMARRALAGFQPRPEAKPEPETEAETPPKPKVETKEKS